MTYRLKLPVRTVCCVGHDAFYEPAGVDTFVATPATAGPWDAGSQHAGPPSALFARAFERHEPVAGQQLARVAVDILRPVPVAPLTLRVRIVRPGRRITLVEGVAEADGQEVLHARGWRIAQAPEQPPVAAPLDEVLPDLPAEDTAGFWPGAHTAGYVEAMEWRFVSGAFGRPGPARVWMRPRLPLVAGEETSPFCRTMMIADSGNGVSAHLDPARWLFVNVDLTVVLHRQPRGEWVLLDAETTIGPAGAALAASRLSDRDGVIGQGMQTLVVARR
ncbi:thioesterase family protein [Planosporangium flavigriseum]|nr:thioesterase family protein [Planosporangium flavigriseum]NJC67544.1 thioesterase family protein [Planosporangium flavigriseum]